MNLLLLTPEDMIDKHIASVRGRQLQHIHTTLKSRVGDKLKVGLLNKNIGMAKIIDLNSEQATLKIDWGTTPPPPLPVTLIIALPRPKMFKRILQTATTMGVKQIYFINAWKVEKSFWQSPLLGEDSILENCTLGLEQAIDTVLPKVHLRKLFKPFVEDELPSICSGTQSLVAHPNENAPCPSLIKGPCTLAIGPEGGFTPYEVNKFIETGFDAVHLGQRIMRVETAVPVLLGRLFDIAL